ncbi:hypothetical protein [Paraburkholderia graminis]
MTEMHLFTVRMPEVISIKSFMELGKHLYTLESQIDAWIEENEVRNFLKTEPQEHISSGMNWGWEAATWAFYNELDALQFKLIFGDRFEYSVYDVE